MISGHHGASSENHGVEAYLRLARLIQDVEGGQGDGPRLIVQLGDQQLHPPLVELGEQQADQHPQELGGVQPRRLS